MVAESPLNESLRDREQGATAFLLDQEWPEYSQFVNQTYRSEDKIFLSLPIKGRLTGPKYDWDLTPGKRMRTSLAVGIPRAFRLRKVRGGAQLQIVRLEFDQKLAKSYQRHVPKRFRHWVVSQNLLPFLQDLGALEGKSYDVLVYRPPIQRMQEILDSAFALHPESTTLSDFRADPSFTQSENKALAGARKIITPHSEMAALFPDRAVHIPWQFPERTRQPRPGNRILFPADVLGAKGAFEIRRLAQELDLELLVLGRTFEKGDFWQGVAIRKVEGDPLDDVGLIVLPAFLEAQPRTLLRAITLGVPIVTTAATGLENRDGVTVVPTGSYEALRDAVVARLSSERSPQQQAGA